MNTAAEDHYRKTLNERRVSFRIARTVEAETEMRVPDWVLNCVGFLAEPVTSGGQPENYDLIGSGFFLSDRRGKLDSGRTDYWFVTAKHLVEDLKRRKCGTIVNRKNGGPVFIPLVGWFYHPTDPTADVALAQILWPQDEVETIAASTDTLLTTASITSNWIGIGDEVFMPGLFSFCPGSKRSLPIMRYGNLAMLPDEQVQTEGGFMDAYLVESRSIGGLSGSPVYVRRTLGLPHPQTDPDGRQEVLFGAGRFFLLGLAHGHWDIKESELNKFTYVQDAKRGVNMGIAIVVPASKIIETLDHPRLMAIRKHASAKRRKQLSPKPDSFLAG